jgi:hypothetical protein
MNDLQTWDYAASVERVRPMVVSWRTLTVELVDELYRAREELSNPRARTDLDCVPNGTQTWARYLDDVGLARTTVHRWLERYEPTEHRIMEPEEVEQRKQIESRAKQDKATAIRQRVVYAVNTGQKPADWDDETEREYNREIKEREARDRRVDEAKQTMEAARLKKEQEQRAWQDRQRENDIDSRLLEEAASRVIAQSQKRQRFKERIKLSQSGESDAFIDALMEYLEELEDDNRRIEACTNIIKVCRNISNELQRGGG